MIAFVSIPLPVLELPDVIAGLETTPLVPEITKEKGLYVISFTFKEELRRKSLFLFSH